MVRHSLLATMLALSAPGAAQAESINLPGALPPGATVVRGIERSDRDPSGGFLPAAGTVEPGFGMAQDGLAYNRPLPGDCCGEAGPGLGRSVGIGVDASARARFVPDAAGSQARASVTVFRGTRILQPGTAPDAGLEVGVARAFAEACDLDVGIRNAGYRPGRAAATRAELGF